MALVFIYGKTAGDTKASTKTIKSMVKASIGGQMVNSIMGNGLMVSSMGEENRLLIGNQETEFGLMEGEHSGLVTL